MGFWNKLGKVATAPVRQLHKVNKGILAGNKQLLKGNIGGAFKTHLRSAVDAGNLTGSPQLNRFNDRLGQRIGVAPPPLVGALAAKPQFGGPPPGAPMPPPGPPAQGVVGGAPPPPPGGQTGHQTAQLINGRQQYWNGTAWQDTPGQARRDTRTQAANQVFAQPAPTAPPPPGPAASGVVGGAPPMPPPQPQPPLNAALMGQAQRRGPRRFPQEYEY